MRNIIIIAFVLLSAASFAQINPKVDSLSSRLTQLGEKPEIVQITDSSGTRQEYRVTIYYSPDMYTGMNDNKLDSMLRDEKKQHLAQLSAIRYTFDQLMGDAKESYHYEYHKEGKDTIIYSMNLSEGESKQSRYGDGKVYFRSRENLQFFYVSSLEGKRHLGNLTYNVYIDKPNGFIQGNLQTFEADIAALFRSHNLKPRTANWLHDKEYSDEQWANRDLKSDFLWKTCFSSSHGNNITSGRTELDIYTMANSQKEHAAELLQQLDSLAQWNSFGIDVSGLISITYRPIEHLRYSLGTLFSCYYDDGANDYSLSIIVTKDEHGYHFALFRTKGALWVPKDWPSVKSFINGKKKYFPGMKPKKGK